MTDHGIIQDGLKLVNLNSYIRVENVVWTKSSANANVSFTDNEKSIAKSYTFTPNMDGQNFIKQAYEHLKTLPKFAGAVDC